MQNMYRKLTEKVKYADWSSIRHHAANYLSALKSVVNCANVFTARVEQSIKKNPVRASLYASFASLFPLLACHNAATLTVFLAAAGTIIVALKYKLDQTGYHKGLFGERFEVFKVIDEIRRLWPNDGATKEMVKDLDDIMRKSYYLFSDETFQFIKKFRQSIITLAFQLPNTPDRPDTIAASEFLISLIDNENLPRMFPELKIDSY